MNNLFLCIKTNRYLIEEIMIKIIYSLGVSIHSNIYFNFKLTGEHEQLIIQRKNCNYIIVATKENIFAHKQEANGTDTFYKVI